MAVEKPNPLKRTFQGSVLKRKQGTTSTPPQQDDVDDVVEEEEWLQQVDEVYDKLSVHDSYNLCDLRQTQKLGSFNVEMLKSICSNFEISFKWRDRKHQLIEILEAMIAECSRGKS